MVSQLAAGPRIDSPKQRLQRVEQPNDKHRRPEGFEIFWREAQPEPFPRARQHQRDKQQRRVAAQREKVGNGGESAHAGNFTGARCSAKNA